MDIQDFYEKNFQRQVRSIQRILKFGKDQAEDIVQSAYVKAMTTDTFDPKRGSLNTWMNKIIFHELRDLQRQPINSPLNENIPDNTHVPYEFIVLEKEIPRVPNEKHRKVIELFYLRGYTGQEIQELTGISVSNVTTICNRFKSFLKEEYNVKL